jgi:ectoine hydroxylase-related dioxygenase (phytanoyl-CoA dioxygenase family)
VPSVRDFINSPSMRALVEPILGPNCSPVRGILFDKVPGANWKVPWHQDLSIAVCERIEIEGFGPWSQKTGILHVQPSARVLENMLTLRLHLDDCFADNGPLRVLPTSHRDGKLSAQQIAEWRRREEEVVCALPRGGVLLMRPLLLHASSASQTPGHRRVLHIEWAAHKLPGGLQWCA